MNTNPQKLDDPVRQPADARKPARVGRLSAVAAQPVVAAEEADAGGAGKKSIIASTIAVLRLLASLDRPVGVNAVARELSLPPSTCFKILRALWAEDCIDFDEDGKTYSLGVGATMLARSALDPACAFSVVRSHLEHVADEASIALGMWRLVSGERMALIGFIEGSADVRVHMRIGQRLPMYLGGLGRAVAAARNESRAGLRAHFEKLRWEVPLSFEDYASQVRVAAELGYAVDPGNFSPGISTVGAVVRDGTGEPRYGISAVILNRPSVPVAIDRIGEIVRDAAHWAERRLFATVPKHSA